MADGMSVGVISLDLVIKNQIEGQLNKIKGSIQNTFSKPMEQASAAAEQAMETAFSTAENAAKRSANALDKTSQDSIKKAIAEYGKFYDKVTKANNTISTQKPKVVQIKYDPEYDTSKVSAEVDKVTEEIKQKTEKTSQKSKSTIESDTKGIIDNTQIQMTKADEIFDKVAHKMVQSFSSSFSKIRSAIGKAVKTAASLIKKTLGGAFNGMKTAASKAIGKVKSHFGSLGKSISGVSPPLKKLGMSIKSAAKSVFLMAGAYTIFRGIKNAVSQACKSNDDFAKSLNEIKANLSIAFTPIMNTIMPYLNALMQGLASVTKTVAAFISELFGTTYKKSLQATKAAKNAAKQAKKSSDEQKRYLDSYDVANVAQDDNSKSDSSSDNSSSDNGIDYSALNGDDVKLPDWAERMKDAIRSGDWAGVGKLIAEKINNAFTNIDWNKIQKKVNGFMKGIADGLNGFIKALKWSKLGQSFGNGINTVFGAAYTFMKTFDWSALGKGVADFLNGAINTTDWTLIGKTLASKLTAVIDTLYSFVTNFNWSEIGNSIGQSVNGWFSKIDWVKLGTTISESVKGLLDSVMGFFESVDWKNIGDSLWKCISSIDFSGIAAKIVKALGGAFGASIAMLWGFIRKAWKKLVGWWKEVAFKDGQFTIKGLLMGILNVFKNIGIWIYNHIFKPFIDGFKKAFGIHSPSKVMAEMGNYLVDGLSGSIKKGITVIKAVFKLLVNGIKEVMKPVSEFFKSLFSGIFSSIKTILGGIIKFIKSTFKGDWKGAWNGIKQIFKGIWNGLSSIVKAPINLIISAVNFLTSKVSDGLNFFIRALNKISFKTPDWVPVIGGKNFGINIPEIKIPSIPKLATGGLATAPTLAMVGDNKNARTDPEVISPLSKLQGMLDNGNMKEVVLLLTEIIEILKNKQYVFQGNVNEGVLFRTLVRLNNENKRRTGASAF